MGSTNWQKSVFPVILKRTLSSQKLHSAELIWTSCSRLHSERACKTTSCTPYEQRLIAEHRLLGRQGVCPIAGTSLAGSMRWIVLPLKEKSLHIQNHCKMQIQNLFVHQAHNGHFSYNQNCWLIPSFGKYPKKQASPARSGKCRKWLLSALSIQERDCKTVITTKKYNWVYGVCIGATALGPTYRTVVNT